MHDLCRSVIAGVGGMRIGRGCALGALVVVLCVAACGGGEKRAAPVTTPLPMQPSGLAVGGDVQPQATDVAQTRITQAQLRTIAAACRNAVEITDANSDPCARAVREQFKHRTPCVRGSACLRAKETVSKSKEGATKTEHQGLVAVIESTGPPCGGPCMRVGVRDKKVLDDVVGTASPGPPAGTPAEPGESAEESPESPGESPGESAGPSEASPGESGPGEGPSPESPDGGGSADVPGSSTSP